MNITFDPAKDAINVAKHGVSLNEAEKFEWDTAITWPDTRRDYGEVRMVGIGYVGSRLHYMAFVERAGAYRIISLRKANLREIKHYAET